MFCAALTRLSMTSCAALVVVPYGVHVLTGQGDQLIGGIGVHIGKIGADVLRGQDAGRAVLRDGFESRLPLRDRVAQ